MLSDFAKELQAKLPRARIYLDAPLAAFSSFRCGGLADLLVIPSKIEDVYSCFYYAFKKGVKITLLGGGTNVLIADKGVRGLLLTLRQLKNWQILNDNRCFAEAGTLISQLAWRLAESHYAGLDYFFAMPGSLGGALFMNARCYGGEIASCVRKIFYLEENKSEPEWLEYKAKEWSYKKSPLQASRGVALAAEMQLFKKDFQELKTVMLQRRDDRRNKGHFRFPNAGSIFKNNRSFGLPSGQIIDQAGLRGLTTVSARASVAPWHGNIIVNYGGAKAAEVYQLIETVKELVARRTGCNLEEEIRYLGEW